MKKRMLLWIAGQALPETSALRPHLRAGAGAVAAAAACGIFVALGLAALLAGFCLHLIGQGVSIAAALVIGGGCALLLAAIALLSAREALARAAQVSEALSLFGGTGRSSLEAAFNTLAEGFLEGVTQPPARRETPPAAAPGPYVP